MTVVLVLATLFVSCSSYAPQMNQKQDTATTERRDEFRVTIPNDTWERIFFETINERATIAKLPSLRVAALPKDDLETRVWVGFGLTPLEGFQLKRSNGQWAGIFMQGIRPRVAQDQYQIVLRAPKVGWEEFWRTLVSKGLVTLPDARSIHCETVALDGIGYVVEYNLENSYRTYMYDNPQFAKCEEAKQIIEIIDTFYEEFGPQLPRR